MPVRRWPPPPGPAAACLDANLPTLRIAPAELGPWLLSRPRGTALCLAGANAAMARAALAAAEVPPDGRQGALFPLPLATPADAIADSAAAALARAALAAFPHWFGGTVPQAVAGMELTLLEQHLRRRLDALPELSPLWARHAIPRAAAGRPPRVGELTLAMELRQLALALAAGSLTLVPVLPDLPDMAAAGAAQRGLEWLARQSGCAVVALLPEAPATVPAWIDRLPCAGLVRPEPPADAIAKAAADADAPWVGPIEGRPHWASAAEQRLAAALAADAELRPLFAFNQTVPTRRGGHPRVDLLWQAGRLVVEIDGYADHATREAFRRDRQRDYELAISGYLVLRLTAEEVLADPWLSLDKLRDAVQFRQGNQMQEHG